MTTVTRVTVRKPQSALEGWIGYIYTADGKRYQVRDKQLVEPWDIGGEFQWDYFPFDEEAPCVRATIKRAKQMGWKPRPQ
jgi:hypothetical protein